jgi:hypothetical protein
LCGWIFDYLRYFMPGRLFCHISIAIFLVAILAIQSSAQTRTCTIKSIVGGVKIRRGESASWTDANLRMSLREKDAVRTLVESEVELETSDGSIMKVGENSTLEMAKLQGQGDVQSTKVRVLNGTVMSNIKRLVNTRSSFDFETPTALASIRGTVIGLDVTSDRTRINVYEGRVLVIPAGVGVGTELRENQMAEVAKGQKTVVAGKLEAPLRTGIFDSTAHASDTVIPVPADSITTSDSTQGQNQNPDSTPVVAKRMLQLLVSAPAEGQKFSKPLIPVNGTATVNAEVTITPPGVRIPIHANGVFSTQAPIPDERGEYIIEIEGSLDGATKKIMRKVVYLPESQFVVAYPQNRQVVSTTLFPVKGEIHPVKDAEIVVLGRKMTIGSDGTFTGMVMIPDEEGEVTLDFEVTTGAARQTVTRTIIYKRAVDTYAPVIQGTLPKFANQRQLCLPVYDRTNGDEITFYYEIDGARDYQKGSGNASFCFTIEPGIHTYVVWAEDKARNGSARLSEHIAYVETSAWYIKVRRPAGVEIIRTPPSPPDDPFEPAYVVEFSIENLPGDDMRLIREVRVINQATGRPPITQSVFTDHYLDFEVPLKPGRSNTIIIEVQDGNGNKKVQQAVIQLK